MMGETLDELCDSLTELCNIPETSPGALYGIKSQAKDGAYKTISDLYVGVVKSIANGLKDKGVYPEYDLIQGFDHEQHFQQVALVSQGAASVFIPQIAFSETQLSNIKFPVCPESELKAGIVEEEGELSEGGVQEGRDKEEDSTDDDNQIGKFWGEGETSKNRLEGAVSDSENDEDLDDEESDGGLFGDADEDGEQSASGPDEEDPSLHDGENWDEVEPLDEVVAEKQPLSTYEKSRRKMSEEIRKMEEKQLEEKPWQLKGDVDASVRPVNSLLEEVLEYDITQRPAPVITEQVTLRLEDVILKRIKDKAFDDVERKIKPVDVPLELKKKIVLDQEKSKLSLAEVYEQEFIKQKSKAKAEVDGAMPTSVVPQGELTAEEKEINTKLAKLFGQLDCLSNFHYTPPPRLAEVEIVSNLPAVTVEEVGQDALTSGSLLTPGEVSGKLNREIKGASEKNKTDKNRERRKKKVHQAKKFKKLQLATAIKSSQPTPGKGKIKLADPALKSSTSFFTQLESQAKKHIDSNKRQAEEDVKNKFKAKKLKL